MPGRHSAEHARKVPAKSGTSGTLKYVVVAVVLLLMIGGGVYAAQKVFATRCANAAAYTLVADPAIAPTLTKIVDSASQDELGCATVTVSAADSATESAAVAQGVNLPSLWVPDSTQWVAETVRKTGSLLDVASQSLASSPVVIVAQKGEAPFFNSWLTALQLQGLGLGNPLTSSVSRAPILAAMAEPDADPAAVQAALVPIADAQARTSAVPNAAQRLAAVKDAGGVAVVSEQQAAMSGDLSAVVPPTGSGFLDFPLVVTERAGSAHDSAKAVGAALASLIQSDTSKSVLSDNGFRTADNAALSNGRGVGPIDNLKPTNQQSAVDALQKYAATAVPSRTLILEDVSASMKTAVGASTRIALTVQATQSGNPLFADTSSVGLWAFAVGLGGSDQNYRELVPVRRMDADIGGATQRVLLQQQTATLPSLVAGETGLYTAALAAVRAMRAEYDANAVNSVLILTDASKDVNNSSTLDQLLATLSAERDFAKPVSVDTVGISDAADAGLLQQISDATGGTSYIARNPSEIPNVFATVLGE